MIDNENAPSTLLKRQRAEEEIDASVTDSNHANINNTITGPTVHTLPYSTNVPNQIFRKLLFDADKTVSSCAWAINATTGSNNNSIQITECAA